MRAPASGGPARAIASALVTAVVVSTLWLRFGDAPADPKKLATTDLANYYYGVTDLVGRRLAAGMRPSIHDGL